MRRWRRLRRRDGHALLLPHFQLRPGGLLDLEGRVRPLAPELEAALKLCDGTRTLGEVARAAGVSPKLLLRQYELGTLVLWRNALEGPPPEGDPPAHVVVSPHLDDAALSLGASMLVGPAGGWLVLDVFSRPAWWRLVRWDGDLLQRVRREEERLMARLAGARLLDLDLPEALLRGHDFGAAFSGEPAEEDREVVARLEAEVAGLARRWSGAHWYLPLGAGGHRDHRICRDAGLRALLGAGTAEDRICFYEDQPYTAALGGVPDFASALPGRALTPHLQEGTAAQVLWKLELSRVYWSQLTRSEIERLGRYARRIGGEAPAERVWRLAAGATICPAGP